MDEQARHFVSFKENQQSSEIWCDFKIGVARHKVFFRCVSTQNLRGNLESFVACALLPCMKSEGGMLNIQGNLSRKFLASLTKIQDIYCAWNSSLHRIKICGIAPVSQCNPAAKKVGVFFSGGVDSFYTFLKHKDEITDLIFIHGTDISLDDKILRQETSERLRKVAAHFDKSIIEIETNVKELLDPYVEWGTLGHGAALASIGHLLAHDFQTIYIGATHTYAALKPWGSNPLLDPLWSSESIEFIHDGCEANRVDKVSLIAKHETALQNLRVCYKNPNSSYNCGVCEKCLRTMISLKVNNALEQCSTFDQKLDLRNVLKINIHKKANPVFVRDNLEALEKVNGDPELIQALRKVLNRPAWPTSLKRQIKKIKKK